MEAYLLSGPQIDNSVSKPEAGMGFQVAELDKREGYIVSSKLFVQMTATSRGQSMEPQYYTKDLAVHAPQPKYMATGSFNVRPNIGRYYDVRFTAQRPDRRFSRRLREARERNIDHSD